VEILFLEFLMRVVFWFRAVDGIKAFGFNAKKLEIYITEEHARAICGLMKDPMLRIKFSEAKEINSPWHDGDGDV